MVTVPRLYVRISNINPLTRKVRILIISYRTWQTFETGNTYPFQSMKEFDYITCFLLMGEGGHLFLATEDYLSNEVYLIVI